VCNWRHPFSHFFCALCGAVADAPGMTSSLAAWAPLAAAPETALILTAPGLAPGLPPPPAACPGPAGPLSAGEGAERGEERVYLCVLRGRGVVRIGGDGG